MKPHSRGFDRSGGIYTGLYMLFPGVREVRSNWGSDQRVNTVESEWQTALELYLTTSNAKGSYWTGKCPAKTFLNKRHICELYYTLRVQYIEIQRTILETLCNRPTLSVESFNWFCISLYS